MLMLFITDDICQTEHPIINLLMKAEMKNKYKYLMLHFENATKLNFLPSTKKKKKKIVIYIPSRTSKPLF